MRRLREDLSSAANKKRRVCPAGRTAGRNQSPPAAEFSAVKRLSPPLFSIPPAALRFQPACNKLGEKTPNRLFALHYNQEKCSMKVKPQRRWSILGTKYALRMRINPDRLSCYCHCHCTIPCYVCFVQLSRKLSSARRLGREQQHCSLVNGKSVTASESNYRYWSVRSPRTWCVKPRAKHCGHILVTGGC